MAFFFAFFFGVCSAVVDKQLAEILVSNFDHRDGLPMGTQWAAYSEV
tara:strand:- start:78 stop:218 length:141 start_codon:yes stop_codon:yes gene_type:complete